MTVADGDRLSLCGSQTEVFRANRLLRYVETLAPEKFFASGLTPSANRALWVFRVCPQCNALEKPFVSFQEGAFFKRFAANGLECAFALLLLHRLDARSPIRFLGASETATAAGIPHQRVDSRKDRD